MSTLHKKITDDQIRGASMLCIETRADLEKMTSDGEDLKLRLIPDTLRVCAKRMIEDGESVSGPPSEEENEGVKIFMRLMDEEMSVRKVNLDEYNLAIHADISNKIYSIINSAYIESEENSDDAADDVDYISVGDSSMEDSCNVFDDQSGKYHIAEIVSKDHATIIEAKERASAASDVVALNIANKNYEVWHINETEYDLADIPDK